MPDYYDHNGKEVEPPKADAVKPSNADRIRAMTDEELAEFMADNVGCDDCRFYATCRHDPNKICDEDWLDWLKQEVEGC